jgi:hypothetical protein
MVGLATRILVARRVAEELRKNGAPEAPIVDAHPSWFYFGCLGPAFADFVPFEIDSMPGLAGRAPYYAVWKRVLEIAMGKSDEPGVVPVLRVFRDFIDELSALVRTRDFDGMKRLRDSGRLDLVTHASADLNAVLARFSDRKELEALGKAMGLHSRPGILNAVTKLAPNQWTGREWLHWKRPGAFAQALRQRAAQTNDPRFIAYALGWTVAYASLLCGSGPMNSLIGASYRNHWWRSRFIGNFVDTWVWGFYDAKAQMFGDDPKPPYSDWRGLCNASLHRLIEVAGALDAEDISRKVVADQPLPFALPSDFVSFWLETWTAVYGKTDAPLFTPNRVQTGYTMLWLTLWFQTSGEVIGCNPAPNPFPPSACGDHPQAPNWTDPTKVNPQTGKPFEVPQPTAKHDPDVAEIVSGAAMALAGLVTFFMGGFTTGVLEIIQGANLIVDGVKTLNWDELECHLYWTNVYLYNGVDALHRLAVFGAIQHPYPRELASEDKFVAFGDRSKPYTAGASTCKSRRLPGMHLPWDGALSTWTDYPSNALEEPIVDVWHLPDRWPSAFIDDAGPNPATEDLLRRPTTWPGEVSGSFGPAVPAAVMLIQKNPPLVDWNLDGDRGRGWLTWEPKSLYSSPVVAVPES